MGAIGITCKKDTGKSSLLIGLECIKKSNFFSLNNHLSFAPFMVLFRASIRFEKIELEWTRMDSIRVRVHMESNRTRIDILDSNRMSRLARMVPLCTSHSSHSSPFDSSHSSPFDSNHSNHSSHSSPFDSNHSSHSSHSSPFNSNNSSHSSHSSPFDSNHSSHSSRPYTIEPTLHSRAELTKSIKMLVQSFRLFVIPSSIIATTSHSSLVSHHHRSYL